MDTFAANGINITPAMDAAMDALDAAEHDVLVAISRNGIGSDLNQPFRDAFNAELENLDEHLEAL